MTINILKRLTFILREAEIHHAQTFSPIGSASLKESEEAKNQPRGEVITMILAIIVSFLVGGLFGFFGATVLASSKLAGEGESTKESSHLDPWHPPSKGEENSPLENRQGLGPPKT